MSVNLIEMDREECNNFFFALLYGFGCSIDTQ